MEFDIEYTGFENKKLVLKTAGFFSGASISLQGRPIEGKKQTFTVQNNDGQEIEIKLKNNLIDPVPKLEIDGNTIELARPLTWYEYGWMGLPIFLVFAGGLFGALFGLIATYSSGRIFRSNLNIVLKYVLSGCISLLACVLFVIVATIIHLLVNPGQ